MTEHNMKEKILVAASESFAARGFEATSLQMLADAVGIKKPSLLYHFRNKEEVRAEVLARLLSQWNARLPEILLAASTGKARFEAILNAGLDFFAEDRSRAQVLVRELLDRPQEMRAVIAEYSKVWVTALSGAIDEGQRSGRIRADVDPKVFITQIASLVVGVAFLEPMSGLFEPEEITITEQAESAWKQELMRIARISLFNARPKV